MERARGAALCRQHPCFDGSRIRTSDVVDVAAHLLAVLYSDHLRLDVGDPQAPGNDHFILSKGHASPLMYSVLKAIGAIDDEQLLTFRTFGSPVQGHPVPLPEIPWVDVATGSLGQGIP